MQTVCVIPARGGSKRLANKNVLPFFGHPMIAYTIAAAASSGLFSEIIVSTDSDAIGRAAEHYGARYLQRPPHLATDTAALVDVAEHVLTTLRNEGHAPDVLCQLMPNCPLRRSADIIEHHRAFIDAGRLFQISVVPYVGVYPQWALTGSSAGEGRWLFGERLVPSQELGTTYCPTGAIWCVNVEAFMQQRKFYGAPFHLAPMDPIRGLDIDDDTELVFADLLVRGMTERDGRSPLEPISITPAP